MQTEIFLQPPVLAPADAGRVLAGRLRDLQVMKSFRLPRDRRFRAIPVPVDNPPEDFPALQKHVRSMSTEHVAHIHVWAGGSERTIYPRPKDNYLFRALHDAYHVELNSSFDLAGELRVSLTMYADLRVRGLEDSAALVYLIDTVGQSLMHYLAGEHVPDQLAFVTVVWDRMLPKMREEPGRVSILPLLQETVRNLAEEQA